mmetsp:Transcript_22586/g.80603  ORF Transcript_22586/g.80603 Transcript_22586/m.80603 type:complete len:254 (+) Transcript_22586:272-1033(+)
MRVPTARSVAAHLKVVAAALSKSPMAASACAETSATFKQSAAARVARSKTRAAMCGLDSCAPVRSYVRVVARCAMAESVSGRRLKARARAAPTSSVSTTAASKRATSSAKACSAPRRCRRTSPRSQATAQRAAQSARARCARTAGQRLLRTRTQKLTAARAHCRRAPAQPPLPCSSLGRAKSRRATRRRRSGQPASKSATRTESCCDASSCGVCGESLPGVGETVTACAGGGGDAGGAGCWRPSTKARMASGP